MFYISVLVRSKNLIGFIIQFYFVSGLFSETETFIKIRISCMITPRMKFLLKTVKIIIKDPANGFDFKKIRIF